MAQTGGHPGLWKALNWLGFLLVVVVGALADSLPIGGKTTEQVAAAHPNLFSPAGFTFAIWAVIYGLMALFCLFQISEYAKNEHSGAIVRRIGPYFFLASLFNVGWVLAWHGEQIALSAAMMALLLLSLVAAYQQVGNRAVSAREKWMVRVPFSVYLAWVTVAFIANVASLVADIDPAVFGMPEEAWTVILIVVASLVALGMLLSRRDIAFAAVIIWALVGIWAKHIGLYQARYAFVLVASAIMIVLLLVDSVVIFVQNLLAKQKELRTAQTQP